MKTWKLINRESEYLEALTKAIDTYHVAPGTNEYEEREFLLALIKDYEEKYVQVKAAG